MALSYFPQIKRVHTSKIFYGQIYIPMANWLLMIGAVIVTAVYNNTTSLGNAYGVCVILVTFITTCMVSLVAVVVWRLSPLLVVPIFLVFAALDGAFLSSALTKVPQGAWFTLLLACVLSVVFILWRFGKEQQWAAEADDRIPPSQLVTTNDDGQTALTPALGGDALSPIRGLALFFDKAGELTPTVFIQFVRKFVAAPEVAVFFHLRPLPMPTVPAAERYAVTATTIPNCYRLVIRHGYADEVISEDLAGLVYEQIRAFVARGGERRGRSVQRRDAPEEKASEGDPSSADASPPNSPTAHVEVDKAGVVVGADEEDDVGARLRFLDAAVARQSVYIVGKEQMRIRPASRLARKIALRAFLWLRENSRSKMAAMNIPTDQLVEVGFVKEV